MPTLAAPTLKIRACTVSHKESDGSRDSGDLLACSILEQLQRGPEPALAKALIDYYNDDGPYWALPPGEFMITRYDWTKDMTVPVAVFDDKGAAEAELERLRAAEVEDRARGTIARNQHYTIVRRPCA
jgi:hypothetical protein